MQPSLIGAAAYSVTSTPPPKSVFDHISVDMTQTLADAEVVERVLDGDVEAFGILVDRYQDEFAGFATLMTGSPDDAADVIQDAFVRAFHGLRGCRDRDNFKSWLFRI